MCLLSKEVGSYKMPWVFFQGRWDRTRYHRSTFKGGGAEEDTMGLLSREVGS